MKREWKCLAGLLVLAAIPSVAHAATVAPEGIRAAVETWVRSVTADARPDAYVERLEPRADGGRVVAYVAHLGGGGYCLAGADDRLLPVTLYRARGAYDATDPNIRLLVADMARRLRSIEAAERNGGQELARHAGLLGDRRMDWAALVAGRPPVPPTGATRSDPVQLTLPVTSYWHQSSPLNDICPELTPMADEHVWVGCVATAAAQIMYYWKWPDTGVGSSTTLYRRRYTTGWISTPLASAPEIPEIFDGRFAWSAGSLRMNGYWDYSMYYGARNLDDDNPVWLAAVDALWAQMTPWSTWYSASHGTTTFDWGIMNDHSEDPPDEGDAEMAQLSYHVAVGDSMDFGVFGSGSDHPRTVRALEDHFRYDPDAWSGPRNASLMITELQWGRPVQLAGADSLGGHSWVVCGYNTAPEPDQFLMNMGWGGGSNDWLTLDQMFPLGQDNMLMVAPYLEVRFVGFPVGGAGDGSPGAPFLDLAQAAAGAVDGATLWFKAGSDNPFAAASVVIDRPMTLRGFNVVIRPE